ncbi:MAG TPA: GNAT family N-acetyltransferase [Nevskiaceae bacterium]|nr:GNAT family N-acetyltransferase [Nevskiaceae bacterium]
MTEQHQSLQIETRGGTEDISDALAVRWAVFVEDQDVPVDLEIDGLDAEAEHFIGYVGDEAVAAARIRPYGHEGVKVERVSVLAAHQGKGYGKTLMRHILGRLDAQERPSVLEAQVHALGFYENLGYSATGDVFMDAGIPHRKMERAAV